MAGNPAALERRRMQMISEVGAENSRTTVMMIPSDLVTFTKTVSEYLREHMPMKPPGVPGSPVQPGYFFSSSSFAWTAAKSSL
jgi:hypothetical protein